MAKPCAVFWDIQNIGVPREHSVNSIINLIRSTIIKPYNLNETSFICVCDVHKLSSNVGHSLTSFDVDIVQAYNEVKDSAGIKIMELMRKFVKFSGQDCTIILLSGDADYYGTLSDLKRRHNVSIHLVKLANSFSPKLDQISDYTFMLDNGILKPIKSTGNPSYFISILNQYSTNNLNGLMNKLNALAVGSIENSAILYDNAICIGFPTLWHGKRAVEQLNGLGFCGLFLKVELIVDSPLTKILKYIKPNGTMQTKNNEEVKQLTFIKMNTSNEADISKITKFCIACSAQSGSQCILSRKPYLWIVYSFKSDAQDCLPKVQIMYPDAAISEPPVDLTSKYHQNPYTVESCEQKCTDETCSGVGDSKIASPKPEKAMAAFPQKQSVNNANYADIKPKESIDWKIFFRYGSSSVAPVPYYQQTKWSLLYNLFEKLYDLGAKKILFDGNLYCAHFDSVSAYNQAVGFKRNISGLYYLKHFEIVSVSQAHKQKVANQMNRYRNGIPWCLNQQLDLYCLVIKFNFARTVFMEMYKKILSNSECVFIRPFMDELWIGFSGECICRSSKEMLSSCCDEFDDALIAKPPNKVLHAIRLQDLVGDAYDLAFLSNQLESPSPITRPCIIERIKFLRMEEKGCKGSIFYINVKGNFRERMPCAKLSHEQIVKIFVKLSKVIPLAATASYDEVNLMFKTWYEAHTARHFINQLSSSEVPYFTLFNGASEVQQQQLAFPSIFKYYLMNDKRKVLEKIVQTQKVVDRQLYFKWSPNESSRSLFVNKASQVQYIFNIQATINYGGEFTPEMISIIRMNLIRLDCPACIKFEGKIWVGVDDLEKGNRAKAIIDQMKFKMLHEKDEWDFEFGLEMKLLSYFPTKVYIYLVHELINLTKTPAGNDVVPLGHFNYSYRKLTGMEIGDHFKSNS